MTKKQKQLFENREKLNNSEINYSLTEYDNFGVIIATWQVPKTKEIKCKLYQTTALRKMILHKLRKNQSNDINEYMKKFTEEFEKKFIEEYKREWTK